MLADAMSTVLRKSCSRSELGEHTGSFAQLKRAEGMRAVIERQVAVLFPQFSTDPGVLECLRSAGIADLQRVADLLVREPTWEQVLQALPARRPLRHAP